MRCVVYLRQRVWRLRRDNGQRVRGEPDRERQPLRGVRECMRGAGDRAARDGGVRWRGVRAELPVWNGRLRRDCQQRVRGQHEHDCWALRDVRDGVPAARTRNGNMRCWRLRGKLGSVCGWVVCVVLYSLLC